MHRISGYGRELFVSNVIKYIADNYQEKFGNIFSEYLPINLSGMRVVREWKHIDICVFVHDSNKPCLIIENKVGAGITESQLSKYEKEGDQGCRYVLLSLRKPPISLPEKWAYMSYGDLANEIFSTFRDSVPSFDNMFIRYFAEYLLTLNEEIDKAQNHVYNNLHVSLKDLIPNDPSRRPYEARIIFESLAMILKERLKDYPVSINTGIGHTTPMLDINFDQCKEDEVRYIMQLQDSTLVVGFVIDNDGQLVATSDDKKKLYAQKKEIRQAMWNAYAPEVLRILASKENANTTNGYTTDKYIVPTIRLKRGNYSINEIFDEISAYVKIITESISSEKNNNNN